MQLYGLDRAELRALCERLGHSSFRGDQIADWLFRKGARSFDAMTNIPRALREQLAQTGLVESVRAVQQARDADGTARFLMQLSDGQTVESVLLPFANRTSVCVSSQVGCAAGCTFCATADCGFIRNLTAAEIVEQVIVLQNDCGSRVSHVVFMGMGEPLLNFDNVVRAIRILNREVGIGMRRISISTVGITPMIRRLMRMDLQLTLAVSLHAPDDSLRRQLIPVASRYSLGELLEVCRDYASATGRRVTFEYLLLAGINDSPGHARKLACLLRGMLCNVNLIPFNQVAGKPFCRPTPGHISAFRRVLEDAGIEVTQRLERGHSVEAACGQLRRRSLDEASGLSGHPAP